MNLQLMPGRTRLAMLLVFMVCSALLARAQAAISLSGQWRFQLDRNDVGLEERWFGRALADSVNLPGDLAEQGIGDSVTVNTKWTGEIVDKSFFTAPEYEKCRQPGNIKVPFWLQPVLQ